MIRSKRAIERLYALDRQPFGDEVRQVVVARQRRRVLEARRADVDRRHPRPWPAGRVLRGLRCAASGDQDVQIVPIGAGWPEQVKFRAASIRALPGQTMTLEICDRRRIGMAGVERPNRVVRVVADSGLVRSRRSRVMCTSLCSRTTTAQFDIHFSSQQSAFSISGGGGERTRRRSTQWLPLPAMSDIFAMASSMVNVLGFCSAGNSLNVSANFDAAACASMMK